MKGKRGIDLQVTGIILAVVVIILLLLASDNVINAFTSRTDVEKCRASLSSKFFSIGPGNNIDLSCPTQYIFLKDKGYVLNSKFDDQFSYDTDDLEFEIKRVFANQMYDCAYKFGHYEVDVFSGGLFEGETHCVICSQISFDQDIQNEVGEEVTGMDSWLDENLLPFGKPGRTDDEGKYIRTYKEYLLKSQKKTEHPFPFVYKEVPAGTLEFSETLDLSKDYYIIFTDYQPSSLEKGFPIQIGPWSTTPGMWPRYILANFIPTAIEWSTGIPLTEIPFEKLFNKGPDSKQTVIMVEGDVVTSKCKKLY